MDEIWCNCPPQNQWEVLDVFSRGRAWPGYPNGRCLLRRLAPLDEALDHPVLSSRPGTFDSQVVEPGPPPVLTSEGIFLIYNGADDKFVYSTGWVLFDKTDPTKVLARADHPIFWPQQEWEKVGQVPNVVFVEGLVRDGNHWLFYYGGADKHIGLASAPVS